MRGNVGRCAVLVAITVVVLGTGLGCGGGGGGDGGGGDQVAQAAALTKEASDALVTGDDNFDAAIVKLQNAVTLDPNNEAARIFLAVANWLDFLHETSDAGGTFYDLYLRSGYVNPNAGGSFYDFTLELSDHGQGQVKNGAPNADELKAFLLGQYLPELAALTNALGGTSPGFDYVIDATQPGRFFDDLAPADRLLYHLDYGDLLAFRAALLAHAAALRLLAAYDWDAVQPNDFDDVDHPGVKPVEVVHSSYPSLGTLENAGLLSAARTGFQDAWQAYLNASEHIRNETLAQEQSGILTLGRDMFANSQERQDALNDEAAFRTQGQLIVGNFTIDSPLLVTTGPDGKLLDPADRPLVNFFQIFEGKDLHALYFATIIDPFTNRRVLGTSDFALFSSAMFTLGNVLHAYGGVAPTAGDVQALGYGVRLDSPPTSAKSIDGAFGDWTPGVNAAQIGATPAVTSLLPCPADVIPGVGGACATDVPDVGSVFTSVQGADLYLYVNRDLAIYDFFQVRVESPLGSAVLFHSGGVFSFFSSDPSLDPVWGHTAGVGIEMLFPTGVGGIGTHAGVTVTVSNNTPQFESERSDMFVRVR